jgi:transcriptional regulator GlxA family with amidase domain
MPHRKSSGNLPARHVAILCFPPVDLLDVAGPAEAFNLANVLSAPVQPYKVQVINAGTGLSIETEAGFAIHGHAALDSERDVVWPIDTLVITAGLSGIDRYPERAIDWVRRNHPRMRRICSVSVGAFPLARTGLLDGRRVTTHWRLADALQLKHPASAVDATRVWVRDGKFYTAAGISTGIDLALGLIAEDLGDRFAHEISEELVLYTRRGNVQPQAPPPATSPDAGHRSLRDLRAWILANLDRPIDIETMARQVAMSRSTLIRHVRRAFGTTPARYVERLRIDMARHYLEETQLPLAAIAHKCGFTHLNTFRRAFRMHAFEPPAEYRKRRAKRNLDG